MAIKLPAYPFYSNYLRVQTINRKPIFLAKNEIQTILTHFISLVFFSTPWMHQKNQGYRKTSDMKWIKEMKPNQRTNLDKIIKIRWTFSWQGSVSYRNQGPLSWKELINGLILPIRFDSNLLANPKSYKKEFSSSLNNFGKLHLLTLKTGRKYYTKPVSSTTIIKVCILDYY